MFTSTSLYLSPTSCDVCLPFTLNRVPIAVYFGMLEVGFSRKEDTTDPSYERGAVLLYELGPGFRTFQYDLSTRTVLTSAIDMLVIYYEEKDSHQTLRELLQRLYQASTMGPLMATTAVMTSDEKVSRVAVMLHDAKTNLDEVRCEHRLRIPPLTAYC